MAFDRCPRGNVTTGLSFVLFLVSLTVLAALGQAGAREPAPDKPLTPQQEERLKQRDQLVGQAVELRKNENWEEAISLANKSLVITRDVLGPDHEHVVNALSWIADVYEQQEKFPESRNVLEEILAIRTKVVGKEHWTTTDARLQIDRINLLEELEKAQRKELVEANALSNQAFKLIKSGKYADALPAALQAVEVERRILGAQNPDYARRLSNVLARTYHMLRQPDKAELLLLEAKQVQAETLGEMHPDYADTLNLLGDVYEITGAYAKSLALRQQALEIRKQTLGDKAAYYAQSLDALANLYKEMGQFAQAEPLFRQSSEIYRDLYGEKHEYYAGCLNNLARLLTQMGQYDKSEALLRQSLEIFKETRGEKHPSYAVNLADLAFLYNRTGETAKAETLYLQALAIEKEVLGEKHPRYAIRLGNLAYTYREAGEYAKAEPLYHQAMQITLERYGEKSPHYATDLNNLAAFYDGMGDNAKAAPLLLKALQIRKEVLGEKHLDYAQSLNNLAGVYAAMKSPAEAEPLYRQALQIRRDILGNDHHDVAISLQNLATACAELDDYVQAASLYREAVDVMQRAVGAKHPDYAQVMTSLAWNYSITGEYDKAEPLYREALQIAREAYNTRHPHRLRIMKDLAWLDQSLGKYGEGEALSLEALQIAREQLDLTAALQSDRQQMAMRLTVWGYLDRYLDLTAHSHASAEQVYREVLHWKGEVGARQQQVRRLRQALMASDDQEVTRLDAELATATRAMAALSRDTSIAPEKNNSQLAALTDQIENLQKDLANRSIAFQKDLAQARRTPEDIRRAIPADAALIDLSSFQYFLPAQEKGQKGSWQPHLVAFVIRRDQPIERVELGPAEPIQKAIENWRKQYGRQTAQADPGTELRRLVWEPLEAHLGDSNTVLISPNALTAPLPWAALPGKRAGTYLIDEILVGLIPIPSLLPDLVSAVAATEDNQDRASSLLLVGDVDFGAEPGKNEQAVAAHSAQRGGQPLVWKSLPGTREEIATIKASFLRRYANIVPAELTQERATKSAVRSAVGKYQFLHFSTHGFFAPPPLRPATDMAGAEQRFEAAVNSFSQKDAGLLSGLVLAGANRPPQDGHEDGILTALEVGEMDLGRVQLATLSACETGLGETAGGEGLLGLQRAFQTAGAKTVVAGLWEVPDKATQVLMTRFYDNLWQKKMSKLEALVEAQRWMVHEGSRQSDLVRGLDPIVSAQQPVDHSGHLSPYYWAAFVLSGDWR